MPGRTLGGRALLAACLFAISGASTVFSSPRTVEAEHVEYLSPRPGATLVSRWNNIVVREGRDIDPASLLAGNMRVVGSSSGPHTGALLLSDDGRSVVFTPDAPFDLGEQVEVSMESGLRVLTGEELPTLSWSFEVSPIDPKRQSHPELEEIFGETVYRAAPVGPAQQTPAAALGAACEALPSLYIPTDLLVSNDPEPGRIFLSPITQVFPGSGHGRLLILDNYNEPLFFRDMPIRTFDFKLQGNGLLTYFEQTHAYFIAMDSTYTPVDTFRTGNGYVTDVHDLIILPNGHQLMMSYDWQFVDMSVLVPGGNSNAYVAGLILQELDVSKNVVFQWRSWDHIPVTDMVECARSLTDSIIDYIHGNSMDMDTDGNLLVSSRHISEITKIDRATGDIIWRLGLNAKQNDFTFVGDTRGFSYQHDARRLPNGNLSLYDNGNCLAPEYSRAVEYTLDETNMLAIFVSEYRQVPDQYGFAMGNVQRRESGGEMICWGAPSMNPNVTDLHDDGTKAWEIGFSEPTTWNYRAFRFPWETTLFSTVEDSLDFGALDVGQTAPQFLTIVNPSAGPLDVTCFASSSPEFSVADAVPFSIAAGESATVTVQFSPTAATTYASRIYVRSANDTNLVARVVAVTGQGTGSVDVPRPSAPRLALTGFVPNPARGAMSVEFVLPTGEPAHLDIFDLQGRKIDSREVGALGPGRVVLPLGETRRLKPGVYILALTQAGESIRRKAVVVR